MPPAISGGLMFTVGECFRRVMIWERVWASLERVT